SVAEVVFSSGAVVCTSTLVLTEPTLSSISTVACCCTSRRKGACVALSNPGASTESAYCAAGSVGKMYLPAESDTVEKSTLRFTSVALILAPGTAAFVLSVIVPRIDPVKDWLQETADTNSREARRLRMTLPFRHYGKRWFEVSLRPQTIAVNAFS